MPLCCFQSILMINYSQVCTSGGTFQYYAANEFLTSSIENQNYFLGYDLTYAN